jgi:hypothetical protein
MLIVVLNASVGEDGWMIETVDGGEAAFTGIDEPTRVAITTKMVEKTGVVINIMTAKPRQSEADPCIWFITSSKRLI